MIKLQGKEISLNGRSLKIGSSTHKITLIGKDFNEIKVGGKQNKYKLLVLSQALMEKYILHKQKDSMNKPQNLKTA